jgi:hypothetical protein
MRKKLDLRPQYMQKLHRTVDFMGYKVSESGVVFNKYGRQVKPKFKFKGKRIDYVYIDVHYNNKKQRMSYHRFVYMAWNKDFAEKNDKNFVVTTLGRRFDYDLKNLVALPREEHLNKIAERNKKFEDDEIDEVVDTYNQVSDYYTQEQFAQKLGISARTLREYIRRGRK